MTAPKDAYGAILSILREDVGVLAIAAAERIGPNVPPDADAHAWIRLVDMPLSRRAFGPGSGRMAVHRWRGIAQCYGPTRDGATGHPVATGVTTARRLAGAASEALRRHRPSVVRDTLLRTVEAEEVSGRLFEPDTHRPYYTVRVEACVDDEAWSS